MLCHFAVHLRQQHLNHCTIKCKYGLERVTSDLGTHLGTTLCHVLNSYVLSGIKQVQAKSAAPSKSRLPITPKLLEHLTLVSLPDPTPKRKGGSGEYSISSHYGGRLQSLDWTKTGLGDWTGGLILKIIFMLLTRPILAYGVMWKPCSLLSAHTVMGTNK